VTQLLDVVLGNNAANSGGAFVQLVTANAVAVGDVITVHVGWFGLATPPTITVSDNGPDLLYNLIAQQQINSGYGVASFSAWAGLALAAGRTLTAAFDVSPTEGYIWGHARTGVLSVSGIPSVVSANGASGASTAHWQSGNVTSSEADGSVIATGVSDAGTTTMNPDSPYVEIEDFNNSLHGVTFEEVHRTDALTGTLYNAGGTVASGTGSNVAVGFIYANDVSGPPPISTEIIRHKNMGKQLSYR
jgi:hypothetical protein